MPAKQHRDDNAVIGGRYNRGRCALAQNSPLNDACHHGNTEVVRALLAKGLTVADIREKNCRAFSSACYSGKLVQLLMDAGLTVTDMQADDSGALRAAFMGGHIGVVRVLLGAGLPLPPPLSSIGLEWMQRSYMKETWTLMYVCEHGRLEMAQLLLSAMTPDELRTQFNTALDWACENSRTEVVNLLMEFTPI